MADETLLNLLWDQRDQHVDLVKQCDFTQLSGLLAQSSAVLSRQHDAPISLAMHLSLRKTLFDTLLDRYPGASFLQMHPMVSIYLLTYSLAYLLQFF